MLLALIIISLMIELSSIGLIGLAIPAVPEPHNETYISGKLGSRIETTSPLLTPKSRKPLLS